MKKLFQNRIRRYFTWIVIAATILLAVSIFELRTLQIIVFSLSLIVGIIYLIITIIMVWIENQDNERKWPSSNFLIMIFFIIFAIIFSLRSLIIYL